MPPLINLFLLLAGMAAAQPVLKTVELEWEAVPGAESYIVKLIPANGEQPIYFTAKDPSLNEQIPAGTYTLQIRSRSKEEDVISKWSDPIELEVTTKEVRPLSPADKAVLEAKSKLTDSIEFSWTPVDKVKEYTITIWTNDLKDQPLTFTTKNTRKSLNVKTGREYFWQVRFDSSNNVSYAQLPPAFSFTLMGPKLIAPREINVTRAGPDHLISWNLPDGAKEFQAKLYFRFLDETEYRPIKDSRATLSNWNAGKLSPGAYKIEVIAKAPQRIDSDPLIHEFTVKPTELELMRN